MVDRTPLAVRRPDPADGQRPTANDLFAMVRRDELWVRGVLEESRINYGQAVERSGEIIARNRIDDPTALARLRDACEEEMGRVRKLIRAMPDARVRGVVTATSEDFESTVAITLDGVSIVTPHQSASADYDRLKSFLQLSTRHSALGTLPMVWRNGSAAVLLHEAIGHAAEHGHAPLAWPGWLRARDETRDGRSADLIAGELPRATRRESFRDVPMRRMTNLIIEQANAPFALPEERMEVHLVAGGAYEPLTEIVTINVAISDIGPFTIRASRAAIARSLIGATGDPLRYPGVICSREAQELYVGSSAPVIITSEIL